MAPRPTLILDKNVLQGLSPAGYLSLADDYHLLMPDVLFFECLKAEPSERARCFRALPDEDRPIELIHDFGHHLRHELQHGQPLGRPSDYPLAWDYRFNPALRESNPLPQLVEDTVESGRKEHLTRVPGYVDRIRSLHKRLSELGDENGWSRSVGADAIRAGLIDISHVRDALRDVRDPEGRSTLPPVESLGPDSAVVVHFQVTHALALQRALDHASEFASKDYVQHLTPALGKV